MIEVLPGRQFCRILKASGSQQVLLRIEEGANGKPVVVSTATFIVDGQATIVSVVMDEVDPASAMSVTGNAALLLEYANAVLGDIESELLRSLAKRDNVGYKGVIYKQLTPDDEATAEAEPHVHGDNCQH